jgi:release factor glutamine methyltransferase
MNASSSMTVNDWLNATIDTFGTHGIDSARLDAMILLGDEIGHDKAWLIAHPEHVLQIENINNLSTKVMQRCTHIPLAYIRGYVEFYGRQFLVNSHVLVPRPETEAMIDLLLSLFSQTAESTNTIAIDVGTGSGAIAITAQLECPELRTLAIDIDSHCLEVATQNAEHLGATVAFKQGDLLDSLSQRDLAADTVVLLANLPYVPSSYPINKAAAHEPSLALFSGQDGLDHYRALFKQAGSIHNKLYILTESLDTQHNSLYALAQENGYELLKSEGLVQLFERSNG